MTVRFIFCVMFLFMAASFLTAAENASSKITPIPRTEAADIIVEWLTKSGFGVSKTTRRDDALELCATRGSERWVVNVKPHSPLASEVKARYTLNGVSKEDQVHSLWNFLDAYTKGASAEVGASNFGVPPGVLSRIESIVCINAKTSNDTYQFSGFIVNTSGLILSTAHNLTGIREVGVSLSDGKSLPGRIISMDDKRDIALIDVSSSLPAAVSLKRGNGPVKMGEKLFSVGCPEGLGGTVYSGFINGPARLVNKQRLIQVSMKVYPGSSGSPVFDAQGNLMAMVKGRFRGTDSLGFLVPHETILAFVRERGDLTEKQAGE